MRRTLHDPGEASRLLRALQTTPPGAVGQRIGPVAAWCRTGALTAVRDQAAELAPQLGCGVEMLRDEASARLRSFDDEALRALCVVEGIELRGAAGPGVAMTWLGSSALPALLEAIVLALLAGRPHLLRLDAGFAACADLLLESWADAQPAERGRFGVVTWPREQSAVTETLLVGCRVVTVFGADAAIEIARRAASHATVVGFGDRGSVAVVLPDATPARIDAVALDVALWEQRGCMAPHEVWCLDADPAAADAVAERIAAALAGLHGRWPRVAVSRETAAALYLAEQAAAFSGPTWSGPWGSVLRVAQSGGLAGPGARSVRVVALPSDGALARLAALPVSTVGIAAGPSLDPLRQSLQRAGVRRVVESGEMQRTRIDRLHDGQRRLQPLLDPGD
jgi:hypothetical protein